MQRGETLDNQFSRQFLLGNQMGSKDEYKLVRNLLKARNELLLKLWRELSKPENRPKESQGALYAAYEDLRRIYPYLE